MTKDFSYSFTERINEWMNECKKEKKKEMKNIFLAFLILTFNLNLPCDKVEVLLEGAQAYWVELSHSRGEIG